jgi:hypothetical protein
VRSYVVNIVFASRSPEKYGPKDLGEEKLKLDKQKH